MHLGTRLMMKMHEEDLLLLLKIKLSFLLPKGIRAKSAFGLLFPDSSPLAVKHLLPSFFLTFPPLPSVFCRLTPTVPLG